MKQILLLVALLGSGYLYGQKQQTEVIKKDIALSQDASSTHLVLNNIFGDVTIEGYNGNSIILEAKKTISGSSQNIIDKGMEEIKLEVIDKGDVIGILMSGPCSKSPALISRENLLEGWNQWDNNCKWNPRYDYEFNFTLKVPKAINLKAGTVNNGEVKATNLSGKLKISNVNGGIVAEKISGSINATTVNGDVTIRFLNEPKDDCKFYTLNGDINAYFPKGLDAYVGFKTFQGDFFTNLDDIEVTAPQVSKTKANKEKGVSFKLDTSQRMKAGNGGVNLKFETFNGNAYLREQ